MYKYIWPTLGPTSIAGAQFLLTLQLLHTLNTAHFGSFSFLMIAAQFFIGIWAALFCAPLPAVATNSAGGDLEHSISALFTTNLICSVFMGFIFFAIALSLSLDRLQAFLFAIFVVLNLLRSFGRAYAYVGGRNLRTTVSDVTYGACLMVGVGAVFIAPKNSLTTACLFMALGSLIGVLTFGTIYLRRQFIQVAVVDLRRYRELWQNYSRWSVLGVITTEATANAQAYIVTLTFGPVAFAPVAASALFIRPITVIMNALTDFERPRLARQIGQGDLQQARSSMRLFRAALWLTWVGSAAVATGILYYVPNIVFPKTYAMTDIAFGAACWMLVSGLRILRMPESTLLQAGGKFRLLAGSSIYSCGFSILAVALLVYFGGPMWSMVGVLAGEFVFAVSVRARATQFFNELKQMIASAA